MSHLKVLCSVFIAQELAVDSEWRTYKFVAVHRQEGVTSACAHEGFWGGVRYPWSSK